MNLENHFYSFDLEDIPIEDSRGVGHEFKVRDELYRTQGSMSTTEPGYRQTEFTITSYRGMGGIHFYGSIKVHTHNRGVTNNNTISGYLGGYKLPKECDSLDISLLRPITPEEIKEYPDRFYGYSDDSLVNCFYSEKEIVSLFKSLIPYIFKGKWEITIDSYSDEFYEIIYINE